MSKTSPTSRFWNYVAECLRLFYWIYFKPYTFKRWLRNIHLTLKPTDNPFDRRSEFPSNPVLHRYAGQVWWLTASVPIFTVLLVAPVYALVSGDSFDWFGSVIFLLGWLIGRVLDRYRNIFVLFLTIFLASRFFSDAVVSVGVWFGIISSLLFGVVGNVARCVLFGVVSGVVFGVAGGMTRGIMFGVVFSVVFSAVFSAMFGVARTVAGGVAFGIAVSVGLGLTLSVKLGVAFGVAVGVVWVFGVLRVYFWLLELLWMFILFWISRSQKQVNYLQYLPPRFDELIILPLPFMNRMIVEAYQKNPVTARESIDYLVTSTNKQQVAIQAITEITINSLNRCQILGDIADIGYQLTWIPSSPVQEIGIGLPQFLDISQGVRASQEATSPYRQYELLQLPIDSLYELKNILAFAKNSALATQLGSITNHWLTILETAQRTLKETTRQSQEIRQVYIAGNSLDPTTATNRFKGRIDIFREIETLTLSDQPPTLLLYGGRRTGKTSALKYLPYKTVPNIIPLLVDLQGAAAATTLQGLAENLAQQIIDTARRLPRRIYLPNPDTYKLAEDPFPALQTWLGEIERSNPSKRFLLCLDEYERLSEVVAATNSRAPLNFIRNLLQHQKQWILLFSGSHQLSELDAYWTDYLINTRALRMSYLQESEARELILQPIEDFPNIYESSAVDLIIQITCCQPYLVQLVCYELVELLNRDIRANRQRADTIKATTQDVQEIIPVVLERGEQYFREIWNILGENERNLLQRVIQGQTPTPQDKGTVRRLTRKEILTQEGNAFQVPLVQKAIEQFLEEN